MTINEENQIEFKIGHPRILGGSFINLNIQNFTSDVRNDMNFIEFPRNPNEASYVEGPENLAVDMLKVEHSWEPTAAVRTQNHTGGGVPALPDSIVVDGGESIEISISDGNGEIIDISQAGFGQLVHFGATKIKENSVTVVNNTSGETLVEGEDYQVDYYRGMIEFASTAGSASDEYEIGYRCKNTARNIAWIIRKIPKMGGESVLVYGIDEDYVDSTLSEGFEHTVFMEQVDLNLRPGRPTEAEVNMQLRDAVLADF